MSRSPAALLAGKATVAVTLCGLMGWYGFAIGRETSRRLVEKKIQLLEQHCLELRSELAKHTDKVPPLPAELVSPASMYETLERDQDSARGGRA